MKKLILHILIVLLTVTASYSQSLPTLRIDTTNIVLGSGMTFPYWLKSGQTLQPMSNVATVSILEFFTDSSGSMKFSQVVSLASGSVGIVPNGRAWKIEGVGLKETANSSSMISYSSRPILFQSPKSYSTPGAYNFVVPPGVTQICIEVWGGGGNGAYSPPYVYSAGGGGGGGYGFQCFTVNSGSTLAVIVGSQGSPSSVSGLISASGGMNALVTQTSVLGGVGGTSSASFNVSGSDGFSGAVSGSISSYNGGKGGDAYNGGVGGNGASYLYPSIYSGAQNGASPGGGGGGGSNVASNLPEGGKGADGKVVIYW